MTTLMMKETDGTHPAVGPVASNNATMTNNNNKEITITPSPSIDGTSSSSKTTFSSSEGGRSKRYQQQWNRYNNKPSLSPQNNKNTTLANGGNYHKYHTYTYPASASPSVPTSSSPPVPPLPSQQQQQQHQSYYNYYHHYYGYYPPPSPISPSPQQQQQQRQQGSPCTFSSASSASPSTTSNTNNSSNNNTVDGFKRLLQQKEDTLQKLREQLEVSHTTIQENSMILEELKADVTRYTKQHDYELELLKFTLPQTFHNQLQNMKLVVTAGEEEDDDDDDEQRQQQQEEQHEDKEKMKNQQEENPTNSRVNVETTTSRSCSSTTIQDDSEYLNQRNSNATVHLEPILKVPTPLSSIIVPPSQEEEEKKANEEEEEQEGGGTTDKVVVVVLDGNENMVVSDRSTPSSLQQQQQQQQQQRDDDYKNVDNNNNMNEENDGSSNNHMEQIDTFLRHEKEVEEGERKQVINIPTTHNETRNNIDKEGVGIVVAVQRHQNNNKGDENYVEPTVSNDHTIGYSYENVDATTGDAVVVAAADDDDGNFDPVSYCNSLLLKKKILKKKNQQDEEEEEEHGSIDCTINYNSTSSVADRPVQQMPIKHLVGPKDSKGVIDNSVPVASTSTDDDNDDEQESFDPIAYYNTLKKQQDEEANISSNPATATSTTTHLMMKEEAAAPTATTGALDEAGSWNGVKNNSSSENSLPAPTPDTNNPNSSSSFSPYVKVAPDPHYLSSFSPYNGEVANPTTDSNNDPLVRTGSITMMGFGTKNSSVNNRQNISADDSIPARAGTYPQKQHFQHEELTQQIEEGDGDEEEEEDRKPAAIEFPPPMTTKYATIQYDFDDESYNFDSVAKKPPPPPQQQQQLQNQDEERTESSQHSEESEEDKKPAAVNIYYPSKTTTRTSIENDFYDEDNNIHDKSARQQLQQQSMWKERQYDIPHQHIDTQINNDDETNARGVVGNFGSSKNDGGGFSNTPIKVGTSTATGGSTEDRHDNNNNGMNNDLGTKPPATTPCTTKFEEEYSTSSEHQITYCDNADRDADDETKKAAFAYGDAAVLTKSPKRNSSFNLSLMSGGDISSNGQGGVAAPDSTAADLPDNPSSSQNESSEEHKDENPSIDSSSNVTPAAKTVIYCNNMQKSHDDRERDQQFPPSDKSQSLGSIGSNNSQGQRTTFHLPPVTPKSDNENSKLKSQKKKVDVTLYESAYSPRTKLVPLVSTTQNNIKKPTTTTLPSSPLDGFPTSPPTTTYEDANQLLLTNDRSQDPDENSPITYDVDGDGERQKVVDKKILDPYGDEGIYTGVVLRSSGMPHGLGKMHYVEDGRIYEGDWQHGRWHGYGYATFPNGDSYQGEYQSDQREGRGIYRWNDGRVYNGFFVDDRRHGRGSFSWPDGAQYEGEFAHGKRCGQGKYIFSSPNGDGNQNHHGDGGFYDGGWKDGKYSGYGVCQWGDGRQYRGEWENGMANGQGIETYPNGIIRHDGLWKDDIPLREGQGYASAFEAPNPEGGACYLVYEPDSSGRLVEVFSKTPIRNAIGRWTPAPGEKRIAKFKFEQNLGKNVLIGNCSAGVVGRKNYASGWCQYVRSAKVMQGEVILWDPVAKGLAVDVYLYTNNSSPAHQTVKLLQGVPTRTDNVLAVACIPKHTRFYEGMAVDMLKWLADGSTYGASSKFQ